jgi:hypothetical protein
MVTSNYGKGVSRLHVFNVPISMILYLLLLFQWHDSPGQALTSSTVHLLSLFSANLLHLLIFSSYKESLLMLSSHLSRGLLTGFFPEISHSVFWYAFRLKDQPTVIFWTEYTSISLSHVHLTIHRVLCYDLVSIVHLFRRKVQRFFFKYC